MIRAIAFQGSQGLVEPPRRGLGHKRNNLQVNKPAPTASIACIWPDVGDYAGARMDPVFGLSLRSIAQRETNCNCLELLLRAREQIFVPPDRRRAM